MIYHTGNFKHERHQLREIKTHADDSFCTSASIEFDTHIPAYSGWKMFGSILLKLKNVEPHEDPWTGPTTISVKRGVFHRSSPRARRAVFWVLDAGKNAKHGLWFGTEGSKPIKMKTNDYVVFDDRRLHWVIADNFWLGVSAQMRKENELFKKL